SWRRPCMSERRDKALSCVVSIRPLRGTQSSICSSYRNSSKSQLRREAICQDGNAHNGFAKRCLQPGVKRQSRTHRTGAPLKKPPRQRRKPRSVHERGRFSSSTCTLRPAPSTRLASSQLFWSHHDASPTKSAQRPTSRALTGFLSFFELKVVFLAAAS